MDQTKPVLVGVLLPEPCFACEISDHEWGSTFEGECQDRPCQDRSHEKSPEGITRTISTWQPANYPKC